MKNIVILVLLCMINLPIFAQWNVELSIGLNQSIRSIDNQYADTYSRESRNGCSIDISTMYTLSEWFGIRSGVQWQQRKYQDKSLLLLDKSYLTCVNSDYFVTIPVYASFILPFKHFSTYLIAGPYIGFNLESKSSPNEISHFEYGLSGGLGFKYKLSSKFAVKAEATIHQSLNNNHETGSEYFKQPSYYTIPAFSLGLSYSIK